MQNPKVLTFIMAGGKGERLYPLTKDRAKPAVPFGGKYRLIDFPLSNCINSQLRQIYVLTQYKSDSLNRHLFNGWGMFRGEQEFIYPIPAQQRTGEDWYQGTADSIRQNKHLIERSHPDLVLILAGDHIYKMDFRQFFKFHYEKKASVTISAIGVDKEKARNNLGVIEADSDGRVIGFEEKPAEPKTIPNDPQRCYSSMGVYVINPNTLLEMLAMEGDDFGKNLIPQKVKKGNGVYSYNFSENNSIKDFVYITNKEGERIREDVKKAPDSSYWKDVGSIDEFWKANMDLVQVSPEFNLYSRWKIQTYQEQAPPSKTVFQEPDRRGVALDSLVSDGVIISGATVIRSILSSGVYVHSMAKLAESVVFNNVEIGRNAEIINTIIDKDAKIPKGMRIGYDLEEDRKRGFTVTDSGIVVVPKGYGN